MLKGLTNTFKQHCNNVELEYSEYVVLNGTQIPIKAQLKDDSYENGNFIGTFILKQISFETEATYDFKNKEFEYYKEVDGESIKIGTFISTDITINDTTEIVKVIGMDYGLKTQVEYTSSLDYSSGNITLKDVWNECCTLSGLESGIDIFTNSDFIVDSDQFTKTGATVRDVFKAIAMSSGTFVKVMNDDKIYLIFNELTSDIENVEINGSVTIQDGYKLVDLQLQGNTTQETTTGKNLLPTTATTQKINGITFTVNEDKTITANGTAGTNGINLYTNGYTYTKVPAGTYTLSDGVPSGESAQTFFTYLDGGPNYNSTINNSTFNLTTETELRIRIVIREGTTLNNVVFKVQLEKGSVATSYEPYTNGASPNPTYPQPINVVSGRQEVDVVGKNWFKYNTDELYTTSQNGTYLLQSGIDTTYINVSQQDNGYYVNSYTNTGYRWYNVKVNLLKNTSYKYLCGDTNITGNTSVKVLGFNSLSNGTVGTLISNLENGTTFNSGNYEYYMIALYPYQQGRYVKDIQIIKSDIEDTTYETYKGQSYEINLGKNLNFTPYVNGTSKTTNGITFSVDNEGKITANGTSTAIAYFYMHSYNLQPYLNLEKSVYFLSGGFSSSCKLMLRLYQDNTYVANFTDSGNGVLVDTRNYTYNRVFLFVQIESGTFYDTTDGHIISNSVWSQSDFIEATGGEKISISSGYNVVNNSYELTQFNENKQWVEGIQFSLGTPKTYTLNANTKYIKIGFRNDRANINIQVEKSSSASSYEPYGMYNKWYKEGKVGKVVLDGNETWYHFSVAQGHLFRVNDIIPDVIQNNNVIPMCNYYHAIAYSQQPNRTNNDVYISLGGQIDILNNNYSNASDFKTWLSTHNTEVYYVLATPTYTEITDSELISQLNAIELLEGINNISVSSGDLGSPLKISYYNDELDIVEDYTELEDKRDTHPWTCLRLGTTQIEGNNLDYIDQELVEKYGENWLILNDNPFAYNQEKRSQLIENIFNQIKEFGYSAFVSKTSFKPYLTSGDIIKFKNRDGDFVKTILLRYNYNYEDLTLEAPSETSATVNYVRPLNTTQALKNIQVIVNQDTQQIISINETVSSQNANINNLTQLVDSQGNDIDALGTRLTQSVDNINASVSAVQQEINDGVGLVKTTSATLDDNGLSISTDTSKIKTTMTNNSFEIKDSGGNSLAFFGYDETEGISKAAMDNLTVTNYFIAGVHRIEKYEEDGEERTGYFYIGG